MTHASIRTGCRHPIRVRRAVGGRRHHRGRQALDAAGWAAGADGIRAKNGQRAQFTLMYPATDSLRKELALAVTADAKKTGIDVRPEGQGFFNPGCPAGSCCSGTRCGPCCCRSSP